MARWGNIGSRGDVEDRRGFAPVVGGVSLTGVALLMLLQYVSGGNPLDVLMQLDSIPTQESRQVLSEEFQGADEYEIFASTVLGSANEMWDQKFRESGRQYVPPKLVLFRSATDSACGTATSDVGPHYCPLDRTIYLDETFFDELQTRFGANGGDVAEAYVIAHEVSHHAQNLLGNMDRVRQLESRNPRNANQYSVQLELQADCMAGLWAYSIRDRNVFEEGEIKEAIDAASAVGDDRIQSAVLGQVNPETWTHGSSSQRVSAFQQGYQEGKLSSCNQLLQL